MEQKSNNALIGSIIIIIILVVGGIYLYNKSINERAAEQKNATDGGLNTLETDLNNTDINSIDQNI